MTDAAKLQIVAIAVAVLALELVTRTGIVTAFTIIPPSRMVVELYRLLISGRIFSDIRSTMSGVLLAAVAAIVTGVLLAALIHGLPRLRLTLDPFFASYYAVPIWVFYPLFVFLFGLTDFPKIVIAYLYAVVAMIVNTINGLDRVPGVMRKTAVAFGMGPLSTLLRITLPMAAPYVFTGVKLAIAYAFIGVVGSEFILSTRGLGYQISWAYTSFDNNALYATVLFVLILSFAINSSLSRWEKSLMRRRGLS